MLVLYTIQKPRTFNHGMQLGFQELGDGNLLVQSLPPPRLEHQIPSHSLCGCGLQRAQLDLLVERITGDDVPPVEDQRAERLTLRVDPDVGLETERIDYRDQAFDVV